MSIGDLISHLKLRFVRRRTLWFPTWLGFLCAASLFAAPVIWWCCYGESFLSLTERQPAEVLVVEGWIGRDGIRAAATEFVKQGYQYIVATGGVTTAERWDEGGGAMPKEPSMNWFDREFQRSELLLPPLAKPSGNVPLPLGIAVWQALHARGLHPKTMNDVFTWGPHARRSRLVFCQG